MTSVRGGEQSVTGRPEQQRSHKALPTAFQGTSLLGGNRAKLRRPGGIKVLLKQQAHSFKKNNGILKSLAKLT